MQLSLANETMKYWENEKQKVLHHRTKEQRHVQVTLACFISRWLPHWEQQIRERLGAVQILNYQ